MQLERRDRRRPKAQAGMTMLEVLISLVIAVFGVLGLMGMQARAQIAEFESYQRSQALMILNDMVDRISFNRSTDAGGYVVGWKCYVVTTNTTTGLPAYGTEYTGSLACLDGTIAGAPKTRADEDIAAWNQMLLGAAELSTAGTKVGGLLGARGCISTDALTGAITIAVAWQGMAPTVAPSNTCGTTKYGADDSLRRVVSTQLVIPVLTTVAP